MFFSKRFFAVVLTVICANALARPLEADSVRKIQPGDTLPIPPSTPNLLFYVQRTANINTVVYELNTSSDKKVKVSDPIHIFWIRYAEQGQKEELSYIQRNFAYGLNIKSLKSGDYELNFVSYKKMKLTMQYSETEKRYRVYTQLGAKKVKVSRVFVKIEGGTFWVPKVTYVEIKGLDTNTGKEVVERFQPQ